MLKADDAATAVVDPFPRDWLDPDDSVADPALWGGGCDADRWKLGPAGDASEKAPSTVYTPTEAQEAYNNFWTGGHRR
jgi:hypothetical protein